jgi:hypothetical protein
MTRPLAGVPLSRTQAAHHLSAAMCLPGVLGAISDVAIAVTGPIPLAPAVSAPRRGSEYAELSRQVKQAGLLERRPAYYAWKIAVTIAMLAAGWTVFVVAGDSW